MPTGPNPPPDADGLDDCPRCGGSHDRVPVRRLNNPSPGTSHYLICPATGQPVILLVEYFPADGRKKRG